MVSYLFWFSHLMSHGSWQVAKLKLLTNNWWDQLMFAEDPPAFEVLYHVKYVETFTYFIWDAIARLLKKSGLASGNTNTDQCIWTCSATSSFVIPIWGSSTTLHAPWSMSHDVAWQFCIGAQGPSEHRFDHGNTINCLPSSTPNCAASSPLLSPALSSWAPQHLCSSHLILLNATHEGQFI